MTGEYEVRYEPDDGEPVGMGQYDTEDEALAGREDAAATLGVPAEDLVIKRDGEEAEWTADADGLEEHLGVLQ